VDILSKKKKKTSAHNSLIKFPFSKHHLDRDGDPNGRIIAFRPAGINPYLQIFLVGI